MAFIATYWPFFAGAIGFLASALGIYEFIRRVGQKRKADIPKYQGALNQDFVHFIYSHESRVFNLGIQLDEEQSRHLAAWLQSEKKEPVVWFSVPHDEYGSEVGFHRNDAEIHWNTRFWDMVHTEGYFKVHSIQGPYQGWMSVTLRGVGLESVAT